MCVRERKRVRVRVREGERERESACARGRERVRVRERERRLPCCCYYADAFVNLNFDGFVVHFKGKSCLLAQASDIYYVQRTTMHLERTLTGCAALIGVPLPPLPPAPTPPSSLRLTPLTFLMHAFMLP